MNRTKENNRVARGFTFTISMLLLLLTLLSVASYSREWRRSQQASFTDVLPMDAIRLRERIAYDMGEMLGARAYAWKQNSSATTALVQAEFPMKREGAPLANMSFYSASFPANLRNTGLEAVLAANGINGSTATVMRVAKNGSLVLSNDGEFDVATYYHPSGWKPLNITISIACEKNLSEFGNLSFSADSSSGAGWPYIVNFTDSSGHSFRANNSTYLRSNASLDIIFPDGGKISVRSNFSGSASANSTSIYYSKSPGATLVLPMDYNASLSYGAVRDYSPVKGNFTLGNMTASYAPRFVDSCYSGGCYSFDGSNDFLLGSANLTESEPEYSLGSELLSDGGFESVVGIPDDGTSDTWFYWTAVNPSGIVFDSTASAQSGARAVKIFQGNQSNYVYQQFKILENVPYALSFYARGNGTRYAIYNTGNSTYLQQNGVTWGTAQSYFNISVAGSGGSYQQVTRQFIHHPVATSASVTLQLRLMASGNGTVYYDSASVRQSALLNGGFEYYYEDTSN